MGTDCQAVCSAQGYDNGNCLNDGTGGCSCYHYQGGGGAPPEAQVCPPGEIWASDSLGCVEGGSDISG